MTGSTTVAPSTLSIPARISNLVMQVLHSYTGRGPTKAWTSIAHDVITVVLRDTLTKGEQSLVSDGHEQFVLDMRKAFQLTMGNDLVAGVENITGRKVLAFLSDNHIDPDIAIENFVLEPTADEPGAQALQVPHQANGNGRLRQAGVPPRARTPVTAL